MSTQPIKTLSDGDFIEGVYLLKKAEVKQTSGAPPKDYFDIVIGDKTGEMPAKLWDVTATQKETFKAGMLAKISGNINTYRDQLQLKINRISELDLLDNHSITDYVMAAPVPGEELIKQIRYTADYFQDGLIHAIVTDCIEKAERKLLTHPAAKGMHHAYYGGLIYHTARMLELGEFILQQRPFLNADLLRAGIILHDIAKTEELTAELGVVKEYSTPGRLLGHISLVDSWIIEAAVVHDIPVGDESVMLLRHMVLSHHNLGEWGSPVQPQIPEAVALHYIDQLDAKLQAAEDAISAMNDSEEWTQPVPILERKALYRPKRNAPAEDDYRLPF